MARPEVTNIGLSVFAAVIFIVAGCNNNPKSSNQIVTGDTLLQPTDTVETVTIGEGINCFAYTKNRDTIFLSLLIKNNIATGKLTYNLYEKDKNWGTIQGRLRGDTLLANYSFTSEGMRSIRQVIFLKKGDILQEGTGSMKEQNNRLIFSDIHDVSFTGNLLLKPVDCSQYHK